MSSSAPELPPEICSAILELLLEDDTRFASGLSHLCRQHPEREAQIRDYADGARQGITAPSRRQQPPMPALQVGTDIGHFRVLERLGEGGMGVVYLAEQRTPVRRRVALKVIKLGMDTKAVLARFDAERQALALMAHSNIAKVYEAGATPDGKPYFAMEHVPGIPITKYCDQNRLTIDERLALFRQVCSGVQHAHTKGVIHRDLTPNNILVSVQDGQPTVKIIDFGLARATDHRLTEQTLFTERGVFAGTPEYMSPEQAGLDGLDIDTRTDVYTLGTLLYELLTGSLPFASRSLRQGGFEGIRRIIREQDPPKPSTQLTSALGASDTAAQLRRTDAGALLSRLRGDLDWVVMKCLEKDRTRRYETVSQLGDEVQRHLANEPVLARAPTLAYRLRKMAARYRPQLLAAAALFVTLVAGLVATIWQASVAHAHAREADESRGKLAARTREFEQLSAVALLDRAIAAAKRREPPWPESVPAMQRWLSEELPHLREVKPRIQATIAELRSRAAPLTPAEVEADRVTHPHYLDWTIATGKLAAAERTQAIREGRQAIEIADLPAGDAERPADVLAELALSGAHPDDTRRAWGQEALALARGRLAWAKAQDLQPADRAPIASALAWALVANGQDREAVTMAEQAVQLSASQNRGHYDGQLALVRSVATNPPSIEALRRTSQQLGAKVLARRTFTVAPESQVLHDQLADFVDRLDELEATLLPLVRRRLLWAEKIEQLTLRHPAAQGDRWQEVRDALAKANGETASRLYAGRVPHLMPQMGLVPIGMNPVTRLWEFYDLWTAWDGESDPAKIRIPKHIASGPRMGEIDVHDDLGIVFVLIPGGRVLIGAQSSDPTGPLYSPDALPSESPFAVDLAPFFIARHEVTQRQWQRLAGDEPSGFRAGRKRGQYATWANPVEQVDWSTSVAALQRHGMALATAAQWEYACRAGSTTPWSCRESELAEYANLLDDAFIAEMGMPGAPSTGNDHHAAHAPVGSFRPNALGLFDMHGNVAEWVGDGWMHLLEQPRAGDGRRADPAHARMRSYRGGGWNGQAHDSRASYARPVEPHFRAQNVGLRAARSIR